MVAEKTGKSYVRLKAAADNYRATGDRLLAHAEQEWDKGDLLQASEKSWGAVSQYVKALAVEYGKDHSTHSDIRQVAQEIALETRDPQIRTLFAVAESLHANFYEAHMDEATVREGMEMMKQYVSILKTVPAPIGRPPKSHMPGRPFYRTRQPQGKKPRGRRLG